MIQVKNMSKVFGPTRALDRISFEVGDRQILGFLGPNGAGKSTAMKIITTYISPTEGTVLVDGLDVAQDPLAVRRKIGYLPETNPLYGEMQVDEYLRFCGRARGLSGGELSRRMDYVVDRCGLKMVFKRNIRELSKGFKQRTGLAQALIHDPEILVLDEPTSGLDPMQIIEIRKLIQELAAEKTVIFSTHILQEVSSTTDRVIIINMGRIIADGRLSELEEEARTGSRLRVRLAASRAEVEPALGGLGAVSGCAVAGEHDGSVTLQLDGAKGADLQGAVGRLAADRSWPVLEMSVPQVSLEDAFIEFIKRSDQSAGREVA